MSRSRFGFSGAESNADVKRSPGGIVIALLVLVRNQIAVTQDVADSHRQGGACRQRDAFEDIEGQMGRVLAKSRRRWWAGGGGQPAAVLGVDGEPAAVPIVHQ